MLVRARVIGLSKHRRKPKMPHIIDDMSHSSNRANMRGAPMPTLPNRAALLQSLL